MDIMKKHLLTITMALTIPLNASGTTFHYSSQKDESGNFFKESSLHKTTWMSLDFRQAIKAQLRLFSV